LQLREGPAGEYRAELSAQRPGLWQLRLVATRGNDRFTQELTIEFDRDGHVLPSVGLRGANTTNGAQ
jgi:hypothetical protein